jgi:hypothetical protein
MFALVIVRARTPLPRQTRQSPQQGLNKFALKSKLYINAIRQAFDELQQLKSATA